MTEASKKRMENICRVFKTTEAMDKSGFDFKAGYQAGMLDPDAGKVIVQDHLGLYERIGRALKDTGAPLTTHEMANMRQVIRSYTQIQAENKRLTNAVGALKKYGQHTKDCVCHMGHIAHENACDCGFDEALKDSGNCE